MTPSIDPSAVPAGAPGEHGDPQGAIDRNPMTWAQVRAVAILILLNALDGFDVLAISFAAPGIADEWGIDRARLGLVLSMELIGMGIGSMCLGGVADALGRQRTILLCLAAMVIGMLLASTAGNLAALSIWRVITGLGIGGMLASTTAFAAELSNERYRSLSVSWVALGYPIGAVLGGSIAALLLRSYDWRSVFVLGAGLTAVSIPLVFLFVPESIAWLCQKRPRAVLARVNASLARLGHAAVTALPPPPSHTVETRFHDIFRGALALPTVLVTTAYFAHITTVYFLLKWLPKISVDLGFSAAEGASVLVWANVGGTLSGLLFGVATRFLPLRGLVIAVLLAAAASIAGLGQAGADLAELTLLAFAAGFFTSAGTVGMYATFAQTFPVRVRAFGTGFGIGVGRGGAVLSPLITGMLFEAGFGLEKVALLLGAGSFLAALALLLLSAAGRRVR